MTKYTKIVLVLLLVIIFVAIFQFSNTKSTQAEVILGGKTFKALVADNDFTRQLGLSGHKPLLDDQAMIFIFSNEGNYGFWMKDMLFPLDIIWIDSNFKITTIEKSLTPETYPKIFYPDSPSMYVLEISAGEADKLNLKIGDDVKFVKK
jgi:uncharacterized membrane protein (UPF0127 family)